MKKHLPRHEFGNAKLSFRQKHLTKYHIYFSIFYFLGPFCPPFICYYCLSWLKVINFHSVQKAPKKEKISIILLSAFVEKIITRFPSCDVFFQNLFSLLGM